MGRVAAHYNAEIDQPTTLSLLSTAMSNNYSDRELNLSLLVCACSTSAWPRRPCPEQVHSVYGKRNFRACLSGSGCLLGSHDAPQLLKIGRRALGYRSDIAAWRSSSPLSPCRPTQQFNFSPEALLPTSTPFINGVLYHPPKIWAASDCKPPVSPAQLLIFVLQPSGCEFRVLEA